MWWIRLGIYTNYLILITFNIIKIKYFYLLYFMINYVLFGTYTIIIGGLIYLRSNNESDGEDINLIKEVLQIT